MTPRDFIFAFPIPSSPPEEPPHVLTYYNPAWIPVLTGLVTSLLHDGYWDSTSGDDIDAIGGLENLAVLMLGVLELPKTLTILNEDGEMNAFVVKDGRIVLESGERLLINTPANAPGLYLFSFSETQQRLYFFGNTYEIMTPDGRRKFFVNKSGIVEVNNTTTNGNTQLIIRANANIADWSPLVIHTKQISFEVTENGAVKAYQALFLHDKTSTNSREAAKFSGIWYEETDAIRKSAASITLQDAAGTYKAFEAKSNAGDILLAFRDKPPVEAATISGNVTDAATLKSLMVALADMGLITDMTTEA